MPASSRRRSCSRRSPSSGRRPGLEHESIAVENAAFLVPDMGASGVLGDPRAATAEAGRAVLDEVVAALVVLLDGDAPDGDAADDDPGFDDDRTPCRRDERGDRMTTFRAGAASLPLEPPLGLPMIGFIRQRFGALGYGLPLEVGAIALERGETRVILCGVDIVGIDAPEIAPLLDRVAAATGRRDGRDPAQLEPHAPRPDRRPAPRRDLRRARRGRAGRRRRVRARDPGQDRLGRRSSPSSGSSPPRVVWGQATADVAVNRRERTADGSNGGTILGWNPDELVDTPGDDPAGAPARRVCDRDARRLRLPSGHDRLRHVRLLGRLPGAVAPRRARGDRRRMRLLPGRRRQRPAAVRVHRRRVGGRADGDAGSRSRRSSRSPTGSRRRSSSSGSTRGR